MRAFLDQLGTVSFTEDERLCRIGGLVGNSARSKYVHSAIRTCGIACAAPPLRVRSRVLPRVKRLADLCDYLDYGVDLGSLDLPHQLATCGRTWNVWDRDARISLVTATDKRRV